jgi:DNA-binding transcriptional MocR family regulator
MKQNENEQNYKKTVHAGRGRETKWEIPVYVPGELCYADDAARRKPDHEMRLSFGNASEADIREGIKRLGQVLKKCIWAGA